MDVERVAVDDRGGVGDVGGLWEGPGDGSAMLYVLTDVRSMADYVRLTPTSRRPLDWRRTGKNDPERSFESAVVVHSLDPINHRQNFGNDRIVMAQRLFRD